MTECFIRRFDEMVASQPDAAAVYVGGRLALTYGELRAQALRYGQDLRARGMGPGDVVAIEVEKSPEYLVAMLGAWYGGAAFLPVNPQLPERRRQRMIEECAGAGYGEELAYVIYTSGSTGEPKGVAVGHGGIVNFIDAQIPAFGLKMASRVLWLLSTDFDASISDVGTALLSGASIFIEDSALLREPRRLLKVLAERRITHVDLPPVLLDVLDSERLPATLETVVFGGEPASPSTVRRWARRVRMVNCYGPTEATVCSSLCVCDENWDRPYIGAPISGVEYKVGGDGELSIGGVGLALGYVNRPRLTAERFVEVGGGRWYRTGDVVRTHEGGRLEFVGRVDRQVKIGGRLIAPEEVESALRRHESVGRAAVIKREVGSRDVLVAFVEVGEREEKGEGERRAREIAKTRRGAKTQRKGKGGMEGLVDELREYLGERLPGWMIPGRWEFVEELAVGATGKIDYQALAGRPLRVRDVRGRFEMTPKEAALGRIWREVLGVDSVRREDDFFALGGDSLAVLQMVALLEEAGLGCTTEEVVRFPRLCDLAGRIGGAGDSGMRAEVLRASARTVASELASERVSGQMSWLASEEASGKRCIFMTGATGFLGSRLLAELLEHTEAEIYCLVRGPGGGCIGENIGGRVQSVCGDLTERRFGLSKAGWEDLASRVDRVYHLGAQVNLALPYADLHAVNVGGTREVLRFVGAGRPKQLHYASTLSVFVSTDHNSGLLTEDDDLSDTTTVYGGYAQTKWEAEVLVREADVGPRWIYRFGLLTGDTTDDLLDLFCRGIIELGAVPREGLELLEFDDTPVDVAAATMAEISRSCGRGRVDSVETFHIASPRSTTLGQLVDRLRAGGALIEAVDREEWRRRVGAHLGRGVSVAQAATFVAMGRLLEDGFFGRHRALDLFQATGCRWGAETLRR